LSKLPKLSILQWIKTLLIELRRILSLLAVPWIGATLLCILASWYLISVVGLDALLAPVLKTWAVFKSFFLSTFKAIPAFFMAVWLSTFGKFSGWIGEFFAALFGYVGGFKAWSFKKFLRQLARFIVTFSARFLLISVILNLLFGHERKGVKQVPKLVHTRFMQSRFGGVFLFWGDRTERQKRLILGLILCLVLVVAGHTLLGLSILLFDLVWELVLMIARLLVRLWRFIWPIVARFIPNAVGNFFTNKVLPWFTNLAPVIRDDHRVMYLRFNVRNHYRNLKAYLYRKSRSKRLGVRHSLRPFVSSRVRKTKTKLLEEAKRASDSTDES